MVDVTKDNFDAICKKIEQLLPLCCFASIDLEFTGLRDKSRGHGARLNRNDLPSQHYMKQRELISNYLMIQFGLCLWTMNESNSQITAHPFNFWTFPQFASYETFSFQASSLQFLRTNGFDFNKWIDGGIDFLSIDREKRQREFHQMNEQKKEERVHQRREKKEIIQPRTQKDADFINEIDEKIKKLLTSTDNLLEFGAINRFRRLLIYQLIDQKYGDLLVAFKQKNDEKNQNDSQQNGYFKNIAVKKVNKNESKECILSESKNEIESEWNDKIIRAIGVRKIFDLLTCNRTPIVLHNGFLDCLHIFRSFIGHKLPFDPCVFTERLHKFCPFIFDTKYLMLSLFENDEKIEGFALNECFHFFVNSEHKQMNETNSLKVNVCIEGDENKEKEHSFLHNLNGSFHEAGYDAFCTGFVFVKIGNYLNAMKQCFDPFVNRLNLSNNHCKFFYVGDEYVNNDGFNLNLKAQRPNNEGIGCDEAIFCGVDFNAISEEWHKMFFCRNENEQRMNEKEFETAIYSVLKEIISQNERISVYHLRLMENQCAIIRIVEVTQTEYDRILNKEQMNGLEFVKFIDYKSRELKAAYQRIYGCNNNKKRSFEEQQQSETDGSSDTVVSNEPPLKKQRVE